MPSSTVTLLLLTPHPFLSVTTAAAALAVEKPGPTSRKHPLFPRASILTIPHRRCPNHVNLPLLMVAVAAVLAADSDVSGSAVSEAAGSSVRGTHGTAAAALRRARLHSDTARRARARELVVVRSRGPPRRQDVQRSSAELDGLVEKSHLFTADPEAASAGKLYRQLALYPAEPSAPSDGSDRELERQTDPEVDLDGELTEEELLLDNGDFGRRLQPERQNTALPAYPPYSHGPLAVPVEPYRSPDYGPASGEARQRTSAEPEPRQTVQPVPRETPRPTARPTARPTPQPEPETSGVPLQGVEEEPTAPAPTEKPAVKEPEPTGYPTRRPYLPRPPSGYGAPVRPKPFKAPRPPQKVAAPTFYKPGAVYYPPRTYHSDQLNEVHSDSLWSPRGPPQQALGPLRSLPVYRPVRPHPDRPEVESGHSGSSGRYHPPSAAYRHYTSHRQAKKSGSFGRARPVSPHRHGPEPADVSYGARTGNDGAFQWFSDHPVGSAHH